MTKAELVRAIGDTTGVSVQRALVELRSELHDAPIECFGRTRRWRLARPFGLPLEAPEREDLVAVLIAQAILEPLADPELTRRMKQIVADLDERLRRQQSQDIRRSLPLMASVSATLTLGTPVDPDILRVLFSSCKRKVLRIAYHSPWKPAIEARKTHDVEPWAIRVHDGAVYLRAWSRLAQGPRTFRVAQIEELSELQLPQTARVPAAAEIWGAGDPALGIDLDRPATAVVRLRGQVARWVSRILWHPTQRDRWLVPGETLERMVKYRSCREMARRLASLADGVESVAPIELHHELRRLLRNQVSPGHPHADQLDDLPGIIQRVGPGRPEQTAAQLQSPLRFRQGVPGKPRR